jgi:hypothetical protein
MSSTSNAQDLLVNVFRPTYRWDSTTGFVPSLTVSNVSEVITGSVKTDALVVSDAGSNAYIGCNAGVYATNTASNVGLGYSAMGGATNSSNNVAVGYYALNGVSNSTSNVVVGAYSGLKSGTRNVLIGPNITVGSGTGNILIGTDISLGTATNRFQLGKLLYGDLSSGYVGVNTSDPLVAFDVSGDTVFRGKVGIQTDQNPQQYSLNVNGSIFANDRFFGGAGTLAAPVYSFDSASNSGMYVPSDASYGTGAFGIVVNQRPAAVFSSNAVNFFQNLDVSGTFSARNVQIAAFAVEPGSRAAPTITFASNRADGFYHLADSSGFSAVTMGQDRMMFLQSGDISSSRILGSDISLAGNIFTSSGCNVIGGVTLSNGNVILPGVSTTVNLVVPGWLRDNESAPQFNITGGTISNALSTTSSNFRARNGTALIPAYSFVNDPSAGIHWVKESTIAFDTSGVQRMCISGANVGIGTITPGYTLDVSGSTRITACSTEQLTQSDDFALALGFSVSTRSKTGQSWTAASFPTGTYRGAAWNGSVWVAAGPGGRTAISTTGTTWTSNAVSFTFTYGVAWGNGLWIAVGEGTNDTLITSTDGMAWSPGGKPSSTVALGAIAWTGSQWVAAGWVSGAAGRILTSPDGSTWTSRTTTLSYPQAIAVDPVSGRILVGGQTTPTANGKIESSTDSGATWQAVYTGGQSIQGLAWNGQLWVGVGIKSAGVPLIVTSSNATDWVERTSPFTTTIYGVAWTGTQWVAGGTGTYPLATSSNGFDWVGDSTAALSTRVNAVAARRVLPNTTSMSMDISLGNINAVGLASFGNFRGSIGSANAPTYSFISDPSSGMHLDIRSTLAFDTSGVQRMCISAGFVGIGTGRPVVALEVVGDISATTYNGPGGTAGAPHYTFSDDRTTGLFFPGANMIGLTAGGLERMRISNGSVAIGTTPSATSALDVSGVLRIVGRNGNITFSNGTIDVSGTPLVSTTGAFSNAATTSNFIGGVTLLNYDVSLMSTGRFVTMPTASSSIGGVTLSSSNITLGGAITGSTANTSNQIGGVTFSNSDLSMSATGRILAPILRDRLNPTLFDISDGNISNSLTTLSSNFRASNGTAGAPAYSFTGDTNTGFYSVRTGLLGFASGGVQRVCISGSAIGPGVAVGIGTSTPQWALDVSGPGPQKIQVSGQDAAVNVQDQRVADPFVLFQNNANYGVYSSNSLPFYLYQSNAVRLAINNGGVGIGTTAPNTAAALLDVSGGVEVRRVAAPTVLNWHILSDLSTGAGTKGYRYGIGLLGASTTGEVGGDFAVTAYSNSDNVIRTQFIIKRSTGYVGMGTTAPEGELQVNNTGQGFATIRALAGNSAGGSALNIPRMRLSARVGTGIVLNYDITGEEVATANNYGLTFGGYNQSNVVRMDMGNRRLGINTMAPTTALDISVGGNTVPVTLRSGNLTGGGNNYIEFFGSSSTGTPGRRIGVGISSSTGSGNDGNDLAFNTYTDAGNYLATPFTLKRDTGFVAIGTSTGPRSLLDLNGGDGSALRIAGTDINTGLLLQGYSNSGSYIRTQAGPLYLGAGGYGPLMTLQYVSSSDLRVGIGGLSPSYALDVSGSARITGGLIFSVQSI